MVEYKYICKQADLDTLQPSILTWFEVGSHFKITQPVIKMVM